ncbi:MAG: hypothetical protein HZB51_21305 [Chloroflexi bacterium]|nr:hypothetical protein [Chloroflexota bacterium]
MSFSTKMLLISAVVIIGICLIIGIIGVILLLPPQTSGATPPPVTSAPGNSWYQVYFTSPIFPDKIADHHGGLDENLTAFINTAQTSVDMAIYQLDLPNVTQAILDAKKRGATVRVVTDIDILNDAKENPSFKQFQAAGITVIGGNTSGIMHNKFVVVDKAAVWLGSWNFTTNDTYRYNNNGLSIQSKELAQNYTATFEKMFVDKKFAGQRKAGGTTSKLTINGITIENYFAPEDKVVDKIVPRLQAAGQKIDFMAYSFTEDKIGQAILARAGAGVTVRGVFENTGSETQFSEYSGMKKAGLDVWQDGNPYLMHHKVFVIDDKTVILGSFNFSVNANTDNDENLLIVDDPALAAQFTAEFGRVYATAKNPPKK